MTQDCIIYIVRHGETVANAQGVLQGLKDYPLTEVGEKQAKERARDFKHIHFDAVFSSDLLRAKRTAQIITLERKLAVQTKEALRERHFGHFEGQPYHVIAEAHKELLEQYKTLTDREKFKFKFEKFVESDEELAGRFITLLREIAVAMPGKTVLMVSHGGIMRSLLWHLGFGTEADLPLGVVKNLGYIKLRTDGVDFFIEETKGIEK